jgi:hypothetical protein
MPITNGLREGIHTLGDLSADIRTAVVPSSVRATLPPPEVLSEAPGWRAENMRAGDGSYVALDLGRLLNGGVAETIWGATDGCRTWRSATSAG